MPQISKQIIRELIETLDVCGVGAHHPDLLPLLAQPETEPFGFVREDYTDARFNTGHIFKKKQGDYSIAVYTHPAPIAPISADDKPDCVFTMCPDDSPTPSTLESSCDGNVLWYMGNPGENKLPKFCWHCGGAVKLEGLANE